MNNDRNTYKAYDDPSTSTLQTMMETLQTARTRMETVNKLLHTMDDTTNKGVIDDVFLLLTQYSEAKVSPEYKQILDTRAQEILIKLKDIFGEDSFTQILIDHKTSKGEQND